ncbi:5-formyltetrahydrofolate cyclo-ligase [Psychromonas sp.]|nr:5-formyltetrahydrofolate cyclo-ligase [Psychromonas sp.]
MTDNITTQRNAIRQQIRTARQSLSSEKQQQASAILLKSLKNHPSLLKSKRVSVTLAHDGEIDLTLLIHWCWQQNKQVFLPVVHPNETGRLLFVVYQHNTTMVKNRYGINEPQLIKSETDPTQFINTCPVSELDILFTPLVAFDHQGNRIGMGGGYYDRLLAPWFLNKTGPYPIGLAHDCQLVNALPIQNWDVPLPEIITPSKHFHF